MPSDKITPSNVPEYRIRNWDKFQHYKDRNPPWIKLHFALLASEDWVTLDDASRVLAVASMLLASQNDGVLVGNPTYIKRVAYLNSDPDLTPLIHCGFLIPLADASTMLADASVLQADARPEERRGEAEERQNQRREDTTASRSQRDYAFEGRVIKLSQQDFDFWRQSFTQLQLRAELVALDAWLLGEDPQTQKKWFHVVSGALAKRNREAVPPPLKEERRRGAMWE